MKVTRNSAHAANGIGSISGAFARYRWSTVSFKGPKLFPPSIPMSNVNCSGEGRSWPSAVRFDFVTIFLAAKKATRAMIELDRYGITRPVHDAIVVIVEGL